MKVLLVTTSFPSAEGLARLPALGIETHVLLPDEVGPPRRDGALLPPTQAFVHRTRAPVPALWPALAAQAAVRLVRREGIDAIVTTGAPSLSLVGATVKRLTGTPWVAEAGGGSDEQGLGGLLLRLADRVANGSHGLGEALRSLE